MVKSMSSSYKQSKKKTSNAGKNKLPKSAPQPFRNSNNYKTKDGPKKAIARTKTS
jgi:hypothetical protein